MANPASAPLSHVSQRRLQWVGDCPLNLSSRWTVEDFQIGIAWLEEEKLRFYPEDRRTWFGKIDDPELWVKELTDYCSKLDISLGDKVGSLELASLPLVSQVFERLLGRAVEELYAENKDRLTISPTAGRADEEAMGTAEAPERLKEFTRKLLFGDASIPLPAEPTVEDCLKVIRSRVVPNDYVTASAAIFNDIGLIRLCATERLGDLRFEIDSMVAKMQAVTANPKTDSKMGRVGV